MLYHLSSKYIMIAFLLNNIIFLGYLSAGLLGAIFFLFAFLAPFESLIWWKNLKIEPIKFVKRLKKFSQETKETPDLFVVYLSGIGVISGEGLEEDERVFVDRLKTEFPHAAIISDIFPYSPNGQSLSSDRFFSSLWKYLEKNRLTNRKNILDLLVMLRNGLQVAVSSDSRYAPIYNLGTTSLILEGLLKKGYDLKNQKPICFIGYSGGAQIALGASTYLSNIIHAPISLITIGGAMNDDPGLKAITHLDYLYSPKDPVERYTPWFFWGRFPINIFSPWNQAVREGKITYTNVGNCTHAYAQSYFDYLHKIPGTQKTYAAKPLETTIALLKLKMPVKTFTGTVHHIREMMHDDEIFVDPKRNTILLTHGKKTKHVLTIFHGYTNSPPQFIKLAMLFYHKGYNIYIPRLPKHGYKEKYYKKTDDMTATMLEDAANQHLDLSANLGDNIHVMGLSLGGVLATYAAQYRSDIASAFIISPFLQFYGTKTSLLRILRFLPHLYIPWSLQKPKKTETAYSHFSAKGAGEILSLGQKIMTDAKTYPPKAREVTFLLNASDVAVSRPVVYQLVKDWKQNGFHHTTIFEIPKGIAPIHDIIDPQQPQQNTAYVYPLILDLFLNSTV